MGPCGRCDRCGKVPRPGPRAEPASEGHPSCAAASLALYGANNGVEDTAILILVYTAIATSTVALPIVATLLSPRRMEPRLIDARSWLDHNGPVVTATIMVMIGVLIAVFGITHL